MIKNLSLQENLNGSCLKSIIQISTSTIQRTIKFSSTIKFASQEMTELLINPTISKECESVIEVYSNGHRVSKISYDVFCSKLRNFIDFLEVKEYSVVGNLDNCGLQFIVCLFLPILMKSQVIFFKDYILDSCFEKLDFLILSTDAFIRISTKKIKWHTIGKIVIFSNKILLEETKKIILEKKIDSSVYVIDEEFYILNVK